MFTKRYKTENQLLIEEEKFRSFFELAINLQVIASIHGEIIEINNASKSILGYKKEELIGTSFLELVYEKDKERTVIQMEKLSKGENVNSFENRYIHKDGSIIYLIWSATTDFENKLIYASAQNISEVKSIEKEKEEKNEIIFQQSKMAIMGEMLGNIAHQMKQPLSLISMSNGLLKLNQDDSDFCTEEEIDVVIDNIDNAVNHLSTTIDDFRTFFKPEKKKSEYLLEDVYFKTERLLKSQLKNNNIKIITKIEELKINGYPNELIQVLINIIKNAKDEFVKDNKHKKPLIFIDAYSQEDSIFIKIKDNAGGVPLSIIENIFKAYFTTKKDSEGTGIGLYLCKQIIEKMNGIISICNTEYKYEDIEYKGALFTIELKQ